MDKENKAGLFKNNFFFVRDQFFPHGFFKQRRRELQMSNMDACGIYMIPAAVDPIEAKDLVEAEEM